LNIFILTVVHEGKPGMMNLKEAVTDTLYDNACKYETPVRNVRLEKIFIAIILLITSISGIYHFKDIQ